MKQPSPWQPERDPILLAVLGKLLEEVNELGAILARCIIQGIEESEPVTGKLNRSALQDEIADVEAGIRVARDRLSLNAGVIMIRRQEKIAHLQGWHRLIDPLRTCSSCSTVKVDCDAWRQSGKVCCPDCDHGKPYDGGRDGSKESAGAARDH